MDVLREIGLRLPEHAKRIADKLGINHRYVLPTESETPASNAGLRPNDEQAGSGRNESRSSSSEAL
jgi:hypothetical protein